MQASGVTRRIKIMKRGNYGDEPEFNEQIVEEYRRASAEGFAKPPASSLRQPPKQEPFKWPGVDQRRDTVVLDRDELTQVVGGAKAGRELVDDTVLAPGRQMGAEWVLDVLGGSLFVLPTTDIIVGRKPIAMPGTEILIVEDPGRTLSKSHARIRLHGGAWFVEDLGSTNGTALVTGAENGPGVEKVLQPGEPAEVQDRFRLGTLHVRLRKLVR